ncbi:SANT/Myb_domain [Hexamita inflata]|uniref:SANT/Myb domain n=1 Tax=Hexamita inflata TaxID=28002 RepID=A0AA86RI94_9EUKA|nr:SANT/Myb domain [Hexamita inflata]
MSDCQKKERVRWTAQEQQMFTKLFKQHRIDFKKYLPFFESRTESQLRSYYYNVLHNNKLVQKSYSSARVQSPLPNSSFQSFTEPQQQFSNSSQTQAHENEQRAYDDLFAVMM